MSHPRSEPEVQPRALHDDERTILNLLLGEDFHGAEQLRAQIAHVRVVGRCSCGCPTVDLEVEPGACERAPGRGRPVLSEALVLDDAGEPMGGVILFLEDGYLSMLEIYGYGPEPIQTWPGLERLRTIVRDA